TAGPEDNFFERGGHSLKAIELLAAIEKVFNRKLPVATLFEAPTVAQMAARLSSQDPTEMGFWRALVAISFGGSRLPIFAVPGVQGNVLVFTRLAALLGPDQPFYALQARGLDGREKPFTRIPKMAAHYVAEIRRVRPEGPYVLLGACTGGV